MSNGTIKICNYHQDLEKTPLIWTFAFNGYEYWCPACGDRYGMLGAGEDVPFTFRLNNRLWKYKAKAKLFLNSTSTLVAARVLYKGKWIIPEDLPEKSKLYHKRVSQSWKYKF